MIAGSGLASGHIAEAALATAAVEQALDKAGSTRAEQVILLLSHDFARQAQAAVLAAASTAACLQVTGCTAGGLLTESGWQIDRPAAAALVLGQLPQGRADGSPLISFSARGHLGYDWQAGVARAGLVDDQAMAWQQARLVNDARSSLRLPLPPAHCLHSRGLRPLSEALAVDAASGHELLQLAGQDAASCLLRALPGELRQPVPLHQICLLRHPDEPGIAVLSINADASLTLAERVAPGEYLQWAIRQPLAAEQEMRQQLAKARDSGPKPDFALMFSCIGRGPLFYGDDDRDWQAFREYYPGVPLIGAYGTGQIVPGQAANRLYHNSVLTLLYESPHV